MKYIATITFILVCFLFSHTNAFSKCMGESTTCFYRVSDAQCRSQEGCSGSFEQERFMSCTGQALPCDQISDRTSCFGQAGCYWRTEEQLTAAASLGKPTVDPLMITRAEL